MGHMSTAAAAAVVSFALSRGLSLLEIQEATGVTGEALMVPESRLPEDVMPNLWCLLSDRFPGEPLTLEMARAAPFSFFGDLAHGAQFADTLRAALSLLRDNRAIMADRLELTIDESADEAMLVAHHPLDVLDSGRALEMGAALVTRLMDEFLGVKNAVASVDFVHGPHAALDHYEAYFKVPVRFGAAQSAIRLAPEALDTPIKYSNVQLFSYVKTHFMGVSQRLVQSEAADPLSGLRKAVARNALSGEYGAAAAAAAANMSLRSAQRFTASHGMSLQGLIERVREDRAKEFLSDPTIDLNAIALLLGYSDDRAFRRAFQRWTGLTPSEYRRERSNRS